MAATLDLGKTSTADRLRIMEDRWQNLTADNPATACPSWHENLLSEGDRLISSGEKQVIKRKVANKQLLSELP
jgi:hypothetical protein